MAGSDTDLETLVGDFRQSFTLFEHALTDAMKVGLGDIANHTPSSEMVKLLGGYGFLRHGEWLIWMRCFNLLTLCWRVADLADEQVTEHPARWELELALTSMGELSETLSDETERT